MNKIILKNFNLEGVEQMSRDQLKDVIGGRVDSSGYYYCNCAGPVGHDTDFTVISNYDDLDVVAAVCDQQYGQGPGYCIAEVPVFHT